MYSRRTGSRQAATVRYCCAILCAVHTWAAAQTIGNEQLLLRSSSQLAKPPLPSTNSVPEQSQVPGQHSALLQHREWHSALACELPNTVVRERLTLGDVLNHTLCKSPALRQALLGIQEQRASVDLAQAAFNPRYSATAEFAGNRVPNSNITAVNSSIAGSVNLSWILFDFGLRNANMEQARQSLSAAMAGQDNSLLTTLNETIRIYAEALSAWNKLDALREAESAANQSLVIAQARYDAQVGSLTEKLQAQTALAQALLDRTRADGVWLAARGALAVAMGLPVLQTLGLADIDSAFPNLEELPPTEDLLVQTKDSHPRIRVLRAEMRALQARLESVRADGRGSVSISGNAGASRSLGNGNSSPGRNVGGSIIASIPLFNDAEQNAREAQLQSQIGAREAQLQALERELETEVWRAAQQVRTETESLIAAKQLMATASTGYQITQGRYKAGVGTFLDVLTAQSAMANARTQLQESKLANMQSRIRLTLATARLGSRVNIGQQK